jgi:hypothetical protein
MRRLGFLYHGTLSSATMRVMIGSEVPSLIAMMLKKLALETAVEYLPQWRHGLDLIDQPRPGYLYPYLGTSPDSPVHT